MEEQAERERKKNVKATPRDSRSLLLAFVSQNKSGFTPSDTCVWADLVFDSSHEF